jgi:hypothetical protein
MGRLTVLESEISARHAGRAGAIRTPPTAAAPCLLNIPVSPFSPHTLYAMRMIDRSGAWE